eukprot:5580287-Alexandrium_andersonii.AAC.1
MLAGGVAWLSAAVATPCALSALACSPGRWARALGSRARLVGGFMLRPPAAGTHTDERGLGRGHLALTVGFMLLLSGRRFC